jgi:prolyl-tRNA synthetase
MSTRTIGGMIMSHADDDGLMMPPRIAPYQVVIIPVVKGDNEDKVMAYAKALEQDIKKAGFRVKLDAREERSSNKMWDAIKKGVPVRVEVGGNEVDAGQVTSVRRDLGRESKQTLAQSEFISALQAVLDDVHDTMFNRAKLFMESHIFDVTSIDEVDAFFEGKDSRGTVGFVKMDAALLEDPDFEKVKKKHAITPRCLPLCENGKTVIVGKSY